VSPALRSLAALAPALLVPLPLAQLGCASSSAGEPCATGFLGSASAAPSLEILAVQPDDSVAALADGGALALMLPPQGGRVVFVGARATNVDGCGLQLTGALRDETSRQVRVDSRTINLIATGGGWGASGVGVLAGNISSFSNIAACPNQWSTTDVFGHDYLLEVSIEDRGGRTAARSIHVTPYCGEPASAAECACVCSAGYVLGQDCPLPDGGATAPDAQGGG
jgi:hypothetical protein